MKLTYVDKVKIYKERREEGISLRELSLKWKVYISTVEYLIRLVDQHGLDILKHEYHYYSPEFKEKAMKRVLVYHESIHSVSIDLGLSRPGTLSRWIKEYKENGYNDVERKRRRHAKADKQTARERNQNSKKAECRITQAERDAYDSERIRKKIECLSFRKNKPRKQEIVQVVTELRQELKRPLQFILMAIKKNSSLPQITRSDYYYHYSHKDSDWKYEEVMNEIIHIFYKHKSRYGYRRITLALMKEGYSINHKVVQRLMKRMGLKGITPRTKYKSYKGDMNGTVKNQLLKKVVDEEKHITKYERVFRVERINKKWTTDVSEFHIAAGKLYLSPILDMYNGEIISYAISKNPSFNQILEMLSASSRIEQLTPINFEHFRSQTHSGDASYGS